jgi:uncharacterized protein YndB with AHSA1/START domain
MSRQADALVLELARVLPGSPERIFAAMTEPAQLARWWGPQGFSIPEVEVDLREGGGYRFAMRPPEGEPFHLSGTFLDVVPPSRLRYTFVWEPPDPDDRETVVSVSLTAVGAATEFSLTQTGFATRARLDLHRDGWTQSLEKLRDIVEPGQA